MVRGPTVKGIIEAVRKAGTVTWGELVEATSAPAPERLKAQVDKLVSSGKLVLDGDPSNPPQRYRLPPPMPKFRRPTKPRPGAKSPLVTALRNVQAAQAKAASQAEANLASLTAKRREFEEVAGFAALAAKAGKTIAAIEEDISFWERRLREAQAGRLLAERWLRDIEPSPPPEAESLLDRLRLHYNRLDREGRLNGFVPIPTLWEAVRGELEGFMDRPEFDRLLLDLAAQRILDLSTLNDPSLVPENLLAQALRDPRDGSIRYYVVWGDRP